MNVRGALLPLLVPHLKRLCVLRELPVSGTKDELRKRLVRSYRGKVRTALDDLRKEELLRVARHYAEELGLPSGLQRHLVDDLRDLLHPEDSPVPVPDEDEGARGRPDRVTGDVDVRFFSFGTEVGVRSTDGIDRLRKEAAAADVVTLISASYTPSVLKLILESNTGDVRILLNGLGGRRLDAQITELRALQTDLGSEGSADVRLGFADGVFHTKLYLFETGGALVAWIGSANATKAGLMGRNEEVLVRVSPAPSSVVNYAESAWERGACIDECRQRVAALPAFFRTGTVYYPPYAVLQKTVNPFRRLLESLPEAERRKISARPVRFADDEAAIGAFNLERVFAQTRALPARVAGPPQQLRFRPYAVETCYGYWVPERLTDEAARMLSQAASSKRELLEIWRDWVLQERLSIVDAFLEYLTDAKAVLDEQRVRWRKYASAGLFERTDRVDGLLDGLVGELSSEEGLERHSQAFVPADMPEIWEDANARMDFEESFFHSLAMHSAARRCPKGARLLLSAIGVNEEADAAQIRCRLEQCLKDESWYGKTLSRPI